MLDLSAFDGGNVTLEAGEPKDGKVKLTAKPAEESEVFFIRVRLNL